ncbi:M23 family metallopeptidase [Spirilliplanes yamanashiensis]|uniref:M23ase beta-sheet core domain-containing protein n=1 Tax=Spirilliplanes yamanashiensis TaxID=42233 RepID=A0A8J3YD20_9ACTN|nr:M23 family metallopeptidase [Spirilliplanes yamanashiensis]MDP9816156.1 murein DD-endopeptidase MepM/ murein hydrolase activator NlpD [Spirilliplanes yamanashiensis]GIJ05679.1 hypothetical protein Sya03_50310 [Spirilliplanes yamanashiensis]
MHAYRTGARLWAALLVPVLALAGSLAGSAAQADPRDDAKAAATAADRAAANLEDATAAAQRAGIALATAEAALPGAQQRVAEAQGRVVAAEITASTARRRADTAQEAYDAVAARFARAQARVESSRDEFGALVRRSYQGGTVATFSVLLKATGPMDALDRYGYVSRVLNGQQDLIDELVAARRAAREAQDAAGAAKRAADEARAEAEAALAAAERAQQEAEQARAAVLALTEQRRTALLAASAERTATLAKYRLARVEEARMVAELRAWERRNGVGPTLQPGARFLMPVHGWKSSDFGMRFHPLYGAWRLHAGVDLAAGNGEPIYAAADGRVMRAGWAGGYGNYTCVSHGRQQGQSISTCYGHQSRILVGDGQRVRRGQVIGRVGSTGGSTGNHLHFEVRVDGDPRNPEKWLPSCLC